MRHRYWSFALSLVFLVLIATACSAIPGSNRKPTVIITSPPHGSTFQEGQDIAFTSTATDSKGVTRVELVVNGAIVRTDQAPNSAGQTTFTLVQNWKGIAGTHTITVRAFNAANVMSDPAVISINVSPAQAAPTAASIPAPTTAPATDIPTVAPTATTAAAVAPPPTSAPPPPTGCTNGSVYVADVTVPDGTVLAQSQAFNKIWRLRNTGTCTWGVGYQFVYVSGEAMATATSIAVPPAAPNGTADFLVPMTAPATPGLHTGRWRLKAPDGNFFGDTVNVTINVLAPAAPPGPSSPDTPTLVPPAPSGSSCSGSPSISSFTASPSSIWTGGTSTLSWNLTNADYVEITPGIGGVPAPGTATVSPAALPATYTLTARCGANTAQRQVTITKSTLVPSQPINPGIFELLFHVDNVTASASRTCGFPNASVTFSGQITTNRDGDVKYQWEGSMPGGPYTLTFASGTTKNVSITRSMPTTITGSGHWTNTLHVLSPTDKSASANTHCPY